MVRRWWIVILIAVLAVGANWLVAVCHGKRLRLYLVAAEALKPGLPIRREEVAAKLGLVDTTVNSLLFTKNAVVSKYPTKPFEPTDTLDADWLSTRPQLIHGIPQAIGNTKYAVVTLEVRRTSTIGLEPGRDISFIFHSRLLINT
jgi:hypothetical protein